MKIKKKCMPIFLSGVFLLIPQTAFAATKSTGRLTDIFQTKAFSGSMETISKFNWVGWLLSGLISIVCLVGLFLTVFRIMTSMMYLSNRNIFDKIHEIKTSNQGEFFGLKALVTSTIKGGNNTGSGIDTFIYFFLGLLPDVKMYSDFADGKELKGVGPDTTITEYILKTSIPSIMMIFFLSIGFSGTLWQMFGTVVDAMSTVAEKVASTSLDAQVNRLLNADSYYKFGFGDDGTNWGKKKENIAKDMYNKVLSKTDSTINGDYSLALGQTIAGYFAEPNGKFSKKNIAKRCGSADYASDDLEAKNVEYRVLINSNPTVSNTTHEVVISFKDLYSAFKQNVANATGSNTSNLYIHVFVYRKESAIKTSYFSLNEKSNDPDVQSSGTLDQPITSGSDKAKTAAPRSN